MTANLGKTKKSNKNGAFFEQKNRKLFTFAFKSQTLKTMNKKLYRSIANKKLSGVCGGIAEYFNLDPTIIRILWVVLTLFSAAFPGVLAYIICALIMPQQNQIENP